MAGIKWSRKQGRGEIGVEWRLGRVNGFGEKQDNEESPSFSKIKRLALSSSRTESISAG